MTSARMPRLERAIYVLMTVGVTASSAVIAFGSVLHWTPWGTASGTVVRIGIALLVAVPALRLAIMAVLFARGRDRTHLAITLVVLAVLVITAAVGTRL